MTMMTDTTTGTGLAGSPMSGPMAIIRAITGAIRFRNTLDRLSQLDDHLLQDIGLTRGDLLDLRIASSPTEVFATLRRMRLYR